MRLSMLCCLLLNIALATTTTTTANTTTTPAPPKRTCKSLGDGHKMPFDGRRFDDHSLGWKTLYKYGQLEIQVEQAIFMASVSRVAINRAVRYSTNGGTTWDEKVEGGSLLSTGTIKTFTNPNVEMHVRIMDYRASVKATEQFVYDVYVTTSAYTGASGQCAGAALTTLTTTTTTTTTPPLPKRLCSSVGDPHIHQFDGTEFDNHDLGWQTLYKCGQFEIQVDQALWLTTGGNAAVSKAVRYKANGQTHWVTVQGGSNIDGTVQTLSDSHGRQVAGTAKTFVNPDVHLLVHVEDRQTQVGVRQPFFYNVYITTSACPGATGQCVQRTGGRRLGLEDAGGGVTFPSGAAVKVTKEQAEEACADLKEQKQNCITDVRMANEPSHTQLIKEDFARVEATVQWIDTEVIGPTEVPVTTVTHGVVPTESTESPFDNVTTTTSDAVSTTTQYLSALAVLVLLAL